MTNTNKNSNKRFRDWAMIVYPESAPEDWRQKLDNLHVPGVGILHDKDVNPDKTPKKDHNHIVFLYSGPKSYNQIKQITDMLNAPIPQAIENGDPAGYLRYLLHMDNPEKHQYSMDELYFFGGFNINQYLDLINNAGTRKQLSQQVINFIIAKHYTSISDLIVYCEQNNRPDWEDIIVNHNTMAINLVLKDQYYKKQRAKEERKEAEKQALLDRHERETFDKQMSKKQKTLYLIRELDKKGKPQKEIADTLGLTVRTVRKYLNGK